MILIETTFFLPEELNTKIELSEGGTIQLTQHPESEFGELHTVRLTLRQFYRLAKLIEDNVEGLTHFYYDGILDIDYIEEIETKEYFDERERKAGVK